VAAEKGVDNPHRFIHTRRPTHVETTLQEARETEFAWANETLVSTDEMDGGQAQLLAEAIAEVRTRARCYLQEPAEAAWYDLVEALTRLCGDGETYDLLRAVTIHSRTGGSGSSQRV
jgi:hypothetical protein